MNPLFILGALYKKLKTIMFLRTWKQVSSRLEWKKKKQRRR